MRKTHPVIKNTDDAKFQLYTRGWALTGQKITLETLARVLFAIFAKGQKLSVAITTPILTITYLIMERPEDGFKSKIAKAITNQNLTPSSQ